MKKEEGENCIQPTKMACYDSTSVPWPLVTYSQIPLKSHRTRCVTVTQHFSVLMLRTCFTVDACTLYSVSAWPVAEWPLLRHSRLSQSVQWPPVWSACGSAPWPLKTAWLGMKAPPYHTWKKWQDLEQENSYVFLKSCGNSVTVTVTVVSCFCPPHEPRFNIQLGIFSSRIC